MKKEMTASQKEAFYNKEIRQCYFNAVRDMVKWEEYDALYDFKRKYPEQFSFFQKVHRLRNEINKDLDAMKLVSDKVYFGTLTFDDAHDKNKIETKRKDAFEKLKSIFKYVLLVEENGGVNGRYHIHFLASFTKDHDFNSFKSLWHSRQNIEEVRDDNVGKYLVSYVVKDLPRLRRNRLLVHLRKKVAKLDKAEFMHRVYSCPVENINKALEDLDDFDKWVDFTFVKSVV